MRIRRSVLETRRASGAHATGHLRVIESVRRAALPHVRGQPRKGETAELEPPARLFGARAGSRRPSLRGDVATRRLRAPSGVRNDAVGSPLGADPLTSHSGLMWDVAEMCSLGNASEPNATGLGSLFGEERVAADAPAFGLASIRCCEPRPSGRRRAPSQEPDKDRDSLPSSTLRVGDAEAVGTARRNVQHRKVWAARQRGSIDRIVLIQSPWEHRAVRSRKAAWPQRTPRWKKALRSTGWKARRGDTRADPRRTARGHASR